MARIIDMWEQGDGSYEARKPYQRKRIKGPRVETKSYNEYKHSVNKPAPAPVVNHYHVRPIVYMFAFIAFVFGCSLYSDYRENQHNALDLAFYNCATRLNRPINPADDGYMRICMQKEVAK